jgi:DNA-binding transcriptional LysR family regulator
LEDEFDQIRVRDLVFFDRLAALGTITATAKEMGVPKPTASRWLAQLERRVGHSLVARSTRHAALTERGEAFHAQVREVLAAVRTAQLVASADEPSGTIRVSVPVPLGRMLGGRVIAAFRRELPRVRLEIALQNHRVDLVRDRFDVAIRGGPLPDSDLIAHRLGAAPLLLYAGADFRSLPLEEIPIIGAPGDAGLLSKHSSKLQAPAVVVDDRSAVADALTAGAGAGILPSFLGKPAVESGALVCLDPEPLQRIDVHAVYLPAQRDDPRLRILIEQIERALTRTMGSQSVRRRES